MAEVFVIVTDEGLYTGTGMVNRWLIGITGSLYRNIFKETPVRSGELRGGLRFHTEHDSLRVLSGYVESTAPHTLFVIEGTAQQGAGYIYRAGADRARVDRLEAQRAAGIRIEGASTRGLWMKLSDARDGRHMRVHGQRANNFMLAGYNRTARASRALHPIFPGFVT